MTHRDEGILASKIVIAADGSTKLPIGNVGNQTASEASGSDAANQCAEALCIKSGDGYKILPLVPDVKKIYLEVTTKCNLACTTCIRNSWDEPLEHMPWSNFQTVLHQLKELPELKTIHFGGFGEPLSHPRILEMVEAVKALGLQAEMISNGVLLTKECAERLLELGLDALTVSFDGPDEEVYNGIRQGSDFNSVVRNIQQLNQLKASLKTAKPTLGIEFVAMRSNYHKLPKLVELANQLQVKKILVTNILPYNEEMKDEPLYDHDDTKLPFGPDSLRLLIKAHLPNMKLRTERYCKFIEANALSISPQGRVSPCNPLLHSYQCYIYGRLKRINRHHVGNVLEHSLREIWTNPTYAYFRSTVKDYRFPSCTDCKQLEGCSYVDDNEMDCWGNSPSCAECLWARGMIVCP